MSNNMRTAVKMKKDGIIYECCKPINLKIIVLDERSQTKMITYYMNLFLQNSRKYSLIRVTESEPLVT